MVRNPIATCKKSAGRGLTKIRPRITLIFLLHHEIKISYSVKSYYFLERNLPTRNEHLFTQLIQTPPPWWVVRSSSQYTQTLRTQGPAESRDFARAHSAPATLHQPGITPLKHQECVSDAAKHLREHIITCPEKSVANLHGPSVCP